MTFPKNIYLPIAPLSDLLKWWKSQRVQGVFIGGLVVALLGRPRVTQDIDAIVMVEDDRWKEFLEAGVSFGFVPRVANPIEFARRTRVLLVHHTRSVVDVDLSICGMEFEREAIARATMMTIDRKKIPILTAEDLIIMKAVARRDRDIIDIEGILDCHPEVDVKRIKHWVSDFADRLEIAEIYTDLEARLKRISKNRRKRQ